MKLLLFHQSRACQEAAAHTDRTPQIALHPIRGRFLTGEALTTNARMAGRFNDSGAIALRVCHNAEQEETRLRSDRPTMFVLAQAVDPNAPPVVDPGLYYEPTYTLWDFVFGWGTWIYLPFLVWMAIWCVRHDPERGVWLWIILLFQPLGAIIYFFARWMPGAHWQPPDFLRQFTRQSEINRLHIAATQIGNPHQYIELGDALRETGNLAQADEAYAQALDKDPKNTQALWGAGCVHFREKQFDQAHDKLATLIDIDPAYKFGDVSLLYAKTLRCLEKNGEARKHLEGHIRRWRHPEALYLLACIYADDGEPAQSREQLQALIMDIEASPSAIARKQMLWKGRAKRLLKRLPK